MWYRRGIDLVFVWHLCGISAILVRCWGEIGVKKSFEIFSVEGAQETSSTFGVIHCCTSLGKIPK